MGFFSSASKLVGGLADLAGGGTQSQSIPATGFYSMPTSYRRAFGSYNTALNDLFKDGGATELFRPIPQTEYETDALETVKQGVAPTAETLGADIAMQMNPFDRYVIDTINRESVGDYSILKQALDEAGQFGSNRQILGANDIDLTRLKQIGVFKQDQYNRAVENSLNEMTQNRIADIGLKFGAGDFLRNLDLMTKQAPVNALSTFGQLLGMSPTSFGTSSPGGTVSSGSSTGDTLSKVSQGLQLAGTVASLFSDERLKEIHKKVGEKNGYNLYEFSYEDDPEQRFVGVSAQEVQEQNPAAVTITKDGYLKVNYGMLGIELQGVH